MVGLSPSQLGSTRLVSGHADVAARVRSITADDILALGPRGGAGSPQTMMRYRRIMANKERIWAAVSVAECSPQILHTTIRAEQGSIDMPAEVVAEAQRRLARVVLDKVRRRFVETALAHPHSPLRSLRLRGLQGEVASARARLGKNGGGGRYSLKEEFHRLEADTEALEAIEHARSLLKEAKEAIERVQAQRRTNRDLSSDGAISEHEIKAQQVRDRVVKEAMEMLRKWKSHSEVAHSLCDALLTMAEHCGAEFREEMDRRGLGVLASTVADLWVDKPEVCRCAVRLLSTVSIGLLLGMLEEQRSRPAVVGICLEVLAKRAKESTDTLDDIVMQGGREALEMVAPLWAGDRMISLHALNLQRRLARSKAKSQGKRRDVSLAPEEAVRMRKAFESYDTNGLGYITDVQLAKELSTLGMKLTEEELREAMREVDVDNIGTISWPEFVFFMSKFGGGMSIEHQFSEIRLKELREVFNRFDADGSGSIDAEELDQVLRSVGLSLQPNEVKAMINSVDADGSQSIEWPEFLYLMSKQNVDADNQHRCAFEYFDRAKRGRILQADFVEQMMLLSQEFSKEELELMVIQAKFEDDDPQSITYKEFVKMMMRA